MHYRSKSPTALDIDEAVVVIPANGVVKNDMEEVFDIPSLNNELLSSSSSS